MTTGRRASTLTGLSGPALLLAILALVALTVRAGSSVHRLAEAYVAPGPNTIGEAGKVYFAARIQEGKLAFADGNSPPYYPSVHGVASHALVAAVGRIAGLRTEQLYGVGRTVSLVMTLLAVVLLVDIGRRSRLSASTMAVGGLLWLGSYPLLQHAVSYRPDNWLLFLSVLACWILIRPTLKRHHFLLLALLPALAFHVKSPGLVLVGVIALGILLRYGRETTAWLVSGQVLIILASVLTLERLSDGTYWDGLASADTVSITWDQALTVLLGTPDPLIPFVVLLPVIFLTIDRSSRSSHRPLVKQILLVFWLGTLGAYGLAAMRMGSNTYYFLEPATYGLLLGLIRFSKWNTCRTVVEGSKRAFRCPVSVSAFVVTLLAIPSVLPLVGDGHLPSVASFRSERVAGYRTDLAARINSSDMYCYTDDPGLNVLLDRPAVIYPVLQTQMMRSGSLAPDTRLENVRRRDFDCVALTGIRWSAYGSPAVGEAFYQAVRRHYGRVERMGPYELRFPPAESHSADCRAGLRAP